MKRMKKLMNWLLAVALMVCVCGTASSVMVAPVMAAEDSSTPRITVKSSDRKRTLVCKKSEREEVLVYEVTSKKEVALDNIPKETKEIQLPEATTSSTEYSVDWENKKIIITENSVVEKISQKLVKGFRNMIRTTVTVTSSIKRSIPFMMDERPVSL